MSAPLSVCVLARDEAPELRRCLDSVAWADEIVVVVDARSDSETEDVARKYTSRVERRPYGGDVRQKEYCAAQASHDWVLILDPDEVVPAALACSIQAVLADEGGEADAAIAYRMNRVTRHLGRWIRHGDFYPDWKLRLFRRSLARFVGRDPHGRVEVDGPIGRLEGDLEHHSYRDLADQVDRIQFFSGEAARSLAAEGVPFRLSALILRPPARFLRSFLLKQGFRDGLPGFVIAAASAFYVFLKYAKLWEIGALRGDTSGRGSAD